MKYREVIPGQGQTKRSFHDTEVITGQVRHRGYFRTSETQRLSLVKLATEVITDK